MVKGALNYKGESDFKRSATATGGNYPIRQFSFMQRILVRSLNGVEFRCAVVTLADGLCNLGGKTTLWLKAAIIGKVSHAPFEL
jgi:hypothetical protein